MPSLKKSEGKKITDDFVRKLCGRTFVECGTTGGRASTGGLKVRSVWGGGGGVARMEQLRSSVYSWKEGTLVLYRQNGGALWKV